MVFNINLTPSNYKYQVESLVKIFYPTAKFCYTQDNLNIRLTFKSGCVQVLLDINGKRVLKTVEIKEVQSENLIVCDTLIKALCECSGKIPNWGMIFGVRPVKYALDLRSKGYSILEIENLMESKLYVSKRRARLCAEICEFQYGLKRQYRNDAFSLYVAIPFCPSRCKYCTFVSHDIQNQSGLMERYIELLIKELDVVADLSLAHNLKLNSIYIGGGTPTTLSLAQLKKLLYFIKKRFLNPIEFCVEAGRVDTLDFDKLRFLKEVGVDRISLNPQTFTQEVLNECLRPLDEKRLYEIYNYANKIGLKNINMDIIAGLPKETRAGFVSSIKKVINLMPSCVTVHALTLKRGSSIDYYETNSHSAQFMVDIAYDLLTQHAYKPYYLYRQKNMIDDLENVGYARELNYSLYNIAFMQEDETVLGCGASSVTKLVLENSIDRVFNYKYPKEYCLNFDEIIKRKEKINLFYNLLRQRGTLRSFRGRTEV